MSNQRSVLVVDDVPANILVIKSILQGGYKIKAATSGAKALTTMLAGSPQAGLLTTLTDHFDAYDFAAALDALARLDAAFPQLES